LLGLGEGNIDGPGDGRRVVGSFVGVIDGMDVGTIGEPVGAGEGNSDGDIVGMEVVGNFVGLWVGIKDGLWLGDDVGRTDGCGDGNGVGGSVSVHSTHVIPITNCISVLSLTAADE